MSDERTEKLLEEIRDLQRESLAEYRRVTQQSLDLQRQAVSRQEQMGQMYRRLLIAGTLLTIPLLLLLVYTLVRFSTHLFG